VTFTSPENEIWYDFYTGQAVKGGETRNVDAPYERMPLFVRGGSIVPMGGEIMYASQPTDEPVTILVYAGRDGKFNLYEDEGTNYNYEKGQYSDIPLTYNDKTRTLTIGQRKGSFKGMKENRDFNVVLIDPEHPVKDAYTVKGKTVKYNGKSVSVKL